MAQTHHVIRLSVTEDVRKALQAAKKRYPALSDPELLKLGLSKIITERHRTEETAEEVRRTAARAVGEDYLANPKEDGYRADMGTSVHFS